MPTHFSDIHPHGRFDCWLAGWQRSGQSVGVSSAGQIIEYHSLCVCGFRGNSSQTLYSYGSLYLLSERLKFSRQTLVRKVSVWLLKVQSDACLGFIVQLRQEVDRERRGLLRPHKVTAFEQEARPYVVLSSPVWRPFSVALALNIPSPSLTKLPARVTATPARASYHRISARSPFQRAHDTSVLARRMLSYSVLSY